MGKDILQDIEELIKSVKEGDDESFKQIKSQQRVDDHGEVFTPSSTVESMLELVEDESTRIDSRFLEPACGSGNFLVPVLKRKLKTAKEKYINSTFERENYCLLAVMSIYGIDILKDNVEECKANLLEALKATAGSNETLQQAAEYVLSVNIVNGDALEMKTLQGEEITFPEWGYLGKGKFQRRDFTFNTLTLSSTFNASDSLFSSIGRHEVFSPAKTYPSATMIDLAKMGAA